MQTPAGTECPFYYEDYHRGRDVQECRLLAQNPMSERWTPDLCGKCEVPEIVLANGCPNLRLEARVARRFGLFRHVVVSAYCVKRAVEVPEPRVGCGDCHLYVHGAETPAAEG